MKEENIFNSPAYLDSCPHAKAYFEYFYGMISTFDLSGSSFEDKAFRPAIETAIFMQGARDGVYWNEQFANMEEWKPPINRVQFAISQAGWYINLPFFTALPGDAAKMESIYKDTKVKYDEQAKAMNVTPEAIDKMLKDILGNGN